MFKAICEVCKEEPQFRTVEADFNGQRKKLNVCMDCAYAIEDMEKREEAERESIKKTLLNIAKSDLPTETKNGLATIYLGAVFNLKVLRLWKACIHKLDQAASCGSDNVYESSGAGCEIQSIRYTK